jgi:hypothetical protein
MKTRRIALAAVLVAGIGLTDMGTAAAQTSGSESFKGLLVASGLSGEREVVASVIVAHGVFNGVGRIVEVDNLPTDPDNVSRDDLVFRRGTMHIKVVNGEFNFSLNPRTCVFTASAEQEGTIEGGTGRFADASGTFTGSVHARGLLRRNPDRSCSQEQAPLIEVDKVVANGTLTF